MHRAPLSLLALLVSTNSSFEPFPLCLFKTERLRYFTDYVVPARGVSSVGFKSREHRSDIEGSSRNAPCAPAIAAGVATRAASAHDAVAITLAA